MSSNDIRTADQVEQQLAKTAQPAYNGYDDEIDLFELVAGLWRKKLLILTVAGAFALAAIVSVLFIITPTYVAKSIIRPTNEATLASLNESNVITVSPEDAFARVVFEARSLDAQRQVFREHKEQLLDTWPPEERSESDVFIETFLPSLTFVIRGMDPEDQFTEATLETSFAHSDPAYSATIANSLITFSQSKARETLLNELRTSLSTRIELLQESIKQSQANIKQNDSDTIARLEEQDQLKRLQLLDRVAALREKAAALRQDRIARLEEALQIAQSLGIEEPTTLNVLARRGATGPSSADQVTLSANLSRESEPDYLKGSKLLSAELQALQQRKSDGPHYPEIRELEEQLTLLSNNRQAEILRAREEYSAFVDGIEVTRAEIGKLVGFLERDYSDLRLVQVDQEATPPRLPTKPKKRLIVIAATVAGGMLGVLLALILNAVENRRRPGESNAV